jgi:hypothetical protein
MKYNKIIIPGSLYNVHYNGWEFIMNSIKKDIVDINSDIVLDSFVDSCLWENAKPNIDLSWVGIVHVVASDPDRMHHQTLNNFVQHPWFLRNKNKCVKLFTLCKYTADILQNLIDIPVSYTYHPKTCEKTFDIQEYLKNPVLNQSGFHSRDIEKFANLNTKIKKKIYTDKEWDKNYINKYLSNKSHNIEIKNGFLNNKEYISNLVCGIGFAYYSDVAASNALLEHIITHTPIIVNKLPAVVEYIGKDYPLFYEDIQHDPDHYLLDEKHIIRCTNYLEERSKLDIFTIEKFKKDIQTIQREKILFYTINDGNENYLKCLDLAYKSLTNILGDVNFKIYTSHDGLVKIKQNNFDYLDKVETLDKVAHNWQYIGDLKYHKKIFEQDYNYFIYLDSDILWKYDNISNFTKQLQNSFGFFVNEGKICETDQQHTLSWSKEDIEKYRNHWGINAGLFGLRKDIALKLSEFFEKEVNNCPAVSVPSQGKIEQSLFNQFIICKEYYNKLLDISDNVHNMYNSEDIKKIKQHPNKIYHFMCFGHGKNKFDMMNSIENRKRTYHPNICIVRPTYYDRSAMLQLSLEYQKAANYSDKFETYIFVDPHPEHGIVSDYDKVITDEYTRINWPKNSGKYSWYDAVKYIFDNTDYDHVISIEDDVLISKDYLRLCNQLYHNKTLTKDDNILYFHVGAWGNFVGDVNKIVRSKASSRSIMIYKKKFEIVKNWIKQQKIIDNDNMISDILNHHKMTTIAPETNRHGHIGIYGWSANNIHGDKGGQKSLFDKPLSHEELYSLLKENCLSGSKLLELNQNKNPSYFWDFDPNINFTKLQYNL